MKPLIISILSIMSFMTVALSYGNDSLLTIDSFESLVTGPGEIKFEKLKNKGIITTTWMDTELYESASGEHRIKNIPNKSELIIYLDHINTVHPYRRIRAKYDGQYGYVHVSWLRGRDIIIKYIKGVVNIREQEIDELITQIEKDKRWVNTFTANVRETPTVNSRRIDQIPQGTPVFIQDQRDGWLKFKYLTTEISRNKLNTLEDVENLYKNGWIHGDLVSRDFVPFLSDEDRRRREFVDKNPSIGKTFATDIMNGRIRIGMNKEMVIASWGRPKDINRTVTAHSVSEQWIYGTLRNRIYVYFRDGIMTSFQD